MNPRTFLFSSLAAALLLVPAIESEACTNVIVTPGASADGSALISYSADSHWLYGELYFHKAADWKPGSLLTVTEWDTSRHVGEIAQVGHTYKTVGNMNEHQLIIAETTFGGREELVDPDGGIDYGSLIYITLQRARTAREAIKVMTDLVKEYGFCSGGESFSIADKNEAWILEMVGKGSLKKNGKNLRKGAVWVARRIPDGYISAHANQARISTFPLYDKENCLYSPDVIDFAREMGYFEGEDEEFSFCDAYCPLDFGGLRACEARVWSAFNIAGQGWFTFEDEDEESVTMDANSYLDYAMGYNKDNRLPLWIKPRNKMTVKDVADIMRDHYEGTPMDMRADIGGGGNALPYRWRPMQFKYGDKSYINERAIATQQTGFWFVGQARKNYPDVLGGIIWFGTDDAATSYLTPIYTNTNEVPECFREGNGSLLAYSPTASFWVNNRVANACYKMYDCMEAFVRAKIDEYENGQLKKVAEMDEKALSLYNQLAEKAIAKAKKKGIQYDASIDTGDRFAAVKKMLTDYSVNTAQKQFDAWTDMEVALLVKFIDGNVKAQNPDGTFVHSKHSERVPDGLTQPGYTNFWKDAVVKAQGEILEVVTPEGGK